MITLVKELQRKTMQATDGSLWHHKQASFSHVFNTDKNSKEQSSWTANGVMGSIHINNYIRGDLLFPLCNISSI